MPVETLHNKMNLSLQLNKSLTSLQDPGPYTPLDQTLKTPIDAPQQNYFFNNPGSQHYQQYQQPGGIPGLAPPNAPHLLSLHQGNAHNQIYSNPHYNESDDILTDVDEPSSMTTNNSAKASKNYSLVFTGEFDHVLFTIYNHILSLPTTTPFLGSIPPSGLVSKVANETIMNLIEHSNNQDFAYDQQHIMNYESLRNSSYQPIFLQLIRKRLIELCSSRNNATKLPATTTISVISDVGSTLNNNNPYGGNNPYNNNVRQSSISNLSLTDLNISNYEQQQQQQQQNKSRSSSVNLRKQSLTRNNSYNNNWLHVGNLNTIKGPPYQHNPDLNGSTDSLQSMQDYVPQSIINRSAGSTVPNSSGAANGNVTTPNTSFNGFNSLMMDYQTPPSSNKSSFSTPGNQNGPPPAPQQHQQQQHQPPQHPGSSRQNSNVQIIQNPNGMDFDDFNFSQLRSNSTSRGNNFPKPLTINTDNANLQALNSLTGNTGDALDSPFMSATTPSEDFQKFMPNSNGFPIISNSIPESPVESIDLDSSIGSKKESHGIPNIISLSEKKRDSLKLKRGIH